MANPIRRQLHPADHRFVQVGGNLHPVTHTFIVKPRYVPQDVLIFEYYCDFRLPDVPGAEGATTVSGDFVYSMRTYQGMHLYVLVNTSTGYWRWDFLPMADLEFTRYYLRTQGSMVWVPGTPFINLDEPTPHFLTLGEVFDTVMWADGRWHPPERTLNFPFPHTRNAFLGGTPPWMPTVGSHAWTFLFNDWNVGQPPREDFVFWIRGSANLPGWTWQQRNMHINDEVFPPGRPLWHTSRIRRISPEWYYEPWKRYPHLV